MKSFVAAGAVAIVAVARTAGLAQTMTQSVCQQNFAVEGTRASRP